MATNQERAAEVFHPSVFIREEITARGWGFYDFLRAAGALEPAGILSWGLYLGAGAEHSDMRMGDSGAAELARAFGTSKELWLNMEKAWREAQHG